MECLSCKNGDIDSWDAYDVRNAPGANYEIIPDEDRFCELCIDTGSAMAWCKKSYAHAIKRIAANIPDCDTSWL